MTECPENQRFVCATGQKHSSNIVGSGSAEKVARVSSVVKMPAFWCNGGSAIEIAQRSIGQPVHFISLSFGGSSIRRISPELGNEHRAVTDRLNGV
jgi:hypothetical protein